MPATSRLTERQNQAYEFIRTYMRTHRKPPTIMEISEALGIRSTNGVFKQLKALEAKGFIAREPHAARGIRLLDADHDPYALDDGVPNLPVVSRTVSHEPHKLRLRPRAYFAVDPYFLHNTDEEGCLIGRAGDDGMNTDGIRKGDFVVIRETERDEIQNDQIAAFLVGEELRVRRYSFVNNRVHLRPADRHYAEEMYPPDTPDCFVIGPVVSVLRRL